MPHLFRLANVVGTSRRRALLLASKMSIHEFLFVTFLTKGDIHFVILNGGRPKNNRQNNTPHRIISLFEQGDSGRDNAGSHLPFSSLSRSCSSVWLLFSQDYSRKSMERRRTSGSGIDFKRS